MLFAKMYQKVVLQKFLSEVKHDMEEMYMFLLTEHLQSLKSFTPADLYAYYDELAKK